MSVNMVAAVTQSQSLAFEAPEDGVMKRLPCGSARLFLNIFLLWRIFFILPDGCRLNGILNYGIRRAAQASKSCVTQ